MNQLASQLPSIDRLLKSNEGRSLVAENGRILVSETLRGIVAEAREQIQRGKGDLTNRDWIAKRAPDSHRTRVTISECST